MLAIDGVNNYNEYMDGGTFGEKGILKGRLIWLMCDRDYDKEESKKMRDPVKTIGNLIDKQGVSFISSVDEEGFPNTKAMLPPRKREGIQVFYFTTNTSSMRVTQYRKNPQACIYFCDRRFFRGVMLTGTMEVLEDSSYKEMIWQEGDTMYYPEGVTDPDYCVLRFTARQGRFYSNFSSQTFDIE